MENGSYVLYNTIEEFEKTNMKRGKREKESIVDNIFINEISKHEDSWDKIYIVVNKKFDTKK